MHVGYTEQTMHRNLNTKLEQSDMMEVKISFISRTILVSTMNVLSDLTLFMQ